jgi:hypothetical protein
MKTQTAAVLEAVSSRIVSATGDRGFESFSLQRRVSRRTSPHIGAEPFGIGSRDGGGIDGAAKKFAGYRWFESISLQQ